MLLPAATGLGAPALVTVRSHLSTIVVLTVVLLLAAVGSAVVDETEELAGIATGYRSGGDARPPYWSGDRNKGGVGRNRLSKADRRRGAGSVVGDGLSVSDVIAGDHGEGRGCRGECEISLACRGHYVGRHGGTGAESLVCSIRRGCVGDDHSAGGGGPYCVDNGKG